MRQAASTVAICFSFTFNSVVLLWLYRQEMTNAHMLQPNPCLKGKVKVPCEGRWGEVFLEILIHWMFKHSKHSAGHRDFGWY